MGIEQFHSNPQPQEKGGDMPTTIEARTAAAVAAASAKYNVDAQLLGDYVSRVAAYRDRYIKGPNDGRNAVLNTVFRGNTESDKKLRSAFARAIKVVQDQLELEEA